MDIDDRISAALENLREELRNEFDIKLSKLAESMKSPGSTGDTGNIRRVEVVSKELADVKGHPNPTEVEQDETEEGHSQKLSRAATGLDVKVLAEEVQMEKLEESAWESTLFIGMPQLSASDSIMLTISLMINVFLQLSFVITVLLSFPADPVDVDNMRKWRYGAGHHVSQVDAFGTSLVARVCKFLPSLSEAGAQSSQLQQIEGYLKGSQGPTLCILVVIVNFILWQKDFERVLKVWRTLWFVRTTPSTTISIHAEETWILQGMSLQRKLFAGMLGLVRLIIATMLLWRGTIWLVYTIGITDLVLNAVALAFILDIDELVYEMYVPRAAKVLTENLEIVTDDGKQSVVAPEDEPAAGGGHYFSIAARRFLRPLFLLAFALAWHFGAVEPNVVHMKKLQDATCGGKKDFAAAYHKDMNLILYAPTKQASGDTKLERVLENIARGESAVAAAALPNDAMLKRWLSKGATGVAEDLIASCKDTTPSMSPTFSDLWKQLRASLSNAANASSCDGVKHQCGNVSLPLVRTLCPEACECSFAKPAWANSKGCPTTKCRNDPVLSAKHSSDEACEDYHSSELANDSAWKSYWKNLAETKALEENKQFTDEQNYAVRNGCLVITQFKLFAEVCADTVNRHSLGTFCPETCQCNGWSFWGCSTPCSPAKSQ